MHEDIVIYQDEFQPPRAGRSWRSILKKVLIVLAILGAAAAAFIIFNLQKISVNPFGFGKLRGEDAGRVNIMMLGVGDPGHAGEALSDTNLMLSVDTRNGKVAIIGIPRDLRVRIPGYGYGKINNANANGGVKTSKRVFEDTLGVPVHYYVKANFSGLREVVDAVGGVDIDNPYSLNDPEYPCDNNPNRQCGFKLSKGKQRLNGATALKYVRCRKGTCGDDFGRAERQQQVMEAIRDKAATAGTVANPVRLGKLVSAAGKNIDTDLSINNLMRLNEITQGSNNSNIINVVFNLGPNGFLATSSNSDLVPTKGNFNEIQNFVQNIFKLGPIWSEQPKVIIQNGTATSGLAGRLQGQLRDDGYAIDIISTTNALKRDYPTSQIIDYTGGKKPNTTNYLKSLLKVQQVSPPPVVTRVPPADIVTIVGADYAAQSTTTAR